MSDKEKQEHIDRLVAQALNLPEADQPGFLDAECPPELRVEVESLLKAHKEVKSKFLRDPPLPGISEIDEAAYVSGSNAAMKETVAYKAADIITRPPTDDRVPRKIGRYEISGIIGEGTFGIVYRARDPALNRDVAIKIPRPEVLRNQIDIDLYLEEARTVANLDHPSIVKVHDFGRTDDGSCYVVSVFVPGGNLRSAMAGRRFDPYQAAELVATVADALHHVHQSGNDVVHRDVKPENILLGKEERPMLTDFGLALRPEDFGRGSKSCGSPAYMSPEQAQGKADKVDGRSDIYSLGVVLFELLTGMSPYRNINNGFKRLLEEIADEEHEVRTPRQVEQSTPIHLNEVCRRALRKNPEDRYETAADFAADLRKTKTKRRPLLWVALAAVVLGFLLWFSLGERQATPEAPLRVLGVDIQHLANLNDQFDQPRGLLGRDSFAARLDDSVNIRARLSKPAYAYIIAFRPDGQEELCFPANESVVPPPTDRPSYPWQRDDVNYGLNEGAGLWCFAVVASENQLPPYAQWRSSQTSPPWQHSEAKKNVVLWHDGQWLDRLTPMGPERFDRGKGVPAKERTPVDDITDWLKQSANADAVGAIAFAVLPKE